MHPVIGSFLLLSATTACSAAFVAVGGMMLASPEKPAALVALGLLLVLYGISALLLLVVVRDPGKIERILGIFTLMVMAVLAACALHHGDGLNLAFLFLSAILGCGNWAASRAFVRRRRTG
jgi:amino acid transporter